MEWVVKFFNHQRWFGFIIPDGGGKDLFFHVTECQEGYEPQEEDRVTYEVGETPKGPAAKKVAPLGAGSAASDDE